MADSSSRERMEEGAGTRPPNPSVGRPWDARLARLLVSPFAETRLHPNHVTTLGLFTGLAAACCYASGTHANLGGVLFVVAALLDHADGELARLTGKTSSFGHTFDRIADLCVKLSLFTGMGVGLHRSEVGDWAIVAGLSAGLSV